MKVEKKVSAAGVAGAVSILLIFLLKQFGVELGAEEGGAIAAILAFGAGYLKRS